MSFLHTEIDLVTGKETEAGAPLVFPVPDIPDLEVSHWPELHTHRYTTEHEAKSFFADWWDRRPKKCGCSDSQAILSENPIDFSSAEKFFSSGVRLHNAVNRKLTKPELTIDKAEKLWLPDKQL